MDRCSSETFLDEFPQTEARTLLQAPGLTTGSKNARLLASLLGAGKAKAVQLVVFPL